MTEKKFYIDGEKFRDEILKYNNYVNEMKKKGEKPEPINDYLATCFMTMASRIATKSCYREYSYTDDMKMEGVRDCIAYIKNYTEDKSPFAFTYFSKAIENAFWRWIWKEKKSKYINYKVTLDAMAEEGFSNNYEQYNDYFEKTKNVIENVERKRAELKEKRQQKKQAKEDEYFDDDE